MILSYDRFSLKNGVFAAEASDLGDFRPEQIYPDACDVGFKMLGKTGEYATFYLADTRQSEGDILYWTFLPTTETVRKIPALKGYRVEIFND